MPDILIWVLLIILFTGLGVWCCRYFTLPKPFEIVIYVISGFLLLFGVIIPLLHGGSHGVMISNP